MSDTLTEVRPKAQVDNDPLDIAIVTMQFPAGAETFVSMRVGELLATGHEVRVYSFRPPAENWEHLLEERGLTGTPADHNGLWATASGVVAALSRPALLARTLSWLLRTSGRQPEHLVRALALLPYAFNVLARLQTRVPDVVHLEWGHYPSVLVPMLRWSGVRTVISLGLIAYDLRRGFEGTRTAAQMADVVRTQTVANVNQVAEYTGLDPADIALVPDGVDTRRNIELSRGVAKVPGRVIVASRLVPHKAVDEALIAFAAAKDADPKARLHVLGGSWDLRGWRLFDIRAQKMWFTSHELRFPILTAPYLYMPVLAPFGVVNLRGALFLDAAHAWNDNYYERHPQLNTGRTLGSAGAGLRLNLFGGFVLRYDVGYRYVDGFQTRDRFFRQFFFGYDF